MGLGSRVKINGHWGEVTYYNAFTDHYEVTWDDSNLVPNPMDVPASEIRARLNEQQNYASIECECGAEKAIRDPSPYCHAVWCKKFKRR